MLKVILIVFVALAINAAIVATLFMIDKHRFFGWLISFESVVHFIHYNDLYDITRASPWLQMVLDERQSDTISVFSGDIIGPSVVSELQKGHQFVKMLDMLRLDLSVPGNHEFDFGEDNFVSFMKAYPHNKWLACNFKVKSGTQVRSFPLIQDDFVVEQAGIKFCFFGLVSAKWFESSKLAGNKFDYEVEDHVEAAIRMTKKLRQQKCDMIMAITHITNDEDEQLLQDKDNGINVIFGGHDHIYYLRRQGNKVLIKSGADFDQFSVIKMAFKAVAENDSLPANNNESLTYLFDESSPESVAQTKWNFVLRSENPDLIYELQINRKIVTKASPPNPEFDRYFHDEVYPLIENEMKVALKVNEDLDGREVYIGKQETAVGNLIADILRIESNRDVALISAGSIKLEKFFKKGDVVRVKDFVKSVRKDDLAFLSMKGEEVLKVLEFGLKSHPEFSYDYFCFSGLSIKYIEVPNEPNRINRFMAFRGQDMLDLNAYYTLSTTGFGAKTIMKQVPTVKEINKDASVVKRTTTDAIKDFFMLPLNPRNREEFRLFKEFFPNRTLESMDYFGKVPNGPIVSTLTRAYLQAADIETVMANFSAELLMRLKFFCLASAIVDEKDNHYFVIEPKVDDRIVFVYSEKDDNYMPPGFSAESEKERIEEYNQMLKEETNESGQVPPQSVPASDSNGTTERQKEGDAKEPTETKEEKVSGGGVTADDKPAVETKDSGPSETVPVLKMLF
jgi:2',3'-cyclic-nucleotide 2'-phosphodiesterase (5'-nucleotidase family)